MTLLSARRPLCVFAHPDDEVFACGLLRCWLEAGADVHGVWLTSGERRGGGALRESELRQSLRLLGLPEANISLPRMPNGWLHLEPRRHRDKLADILRAHRPDLLLTPAWEGGHPDHDMAQMLVAAARCLTTGAPLWEYPLYARDPAQGALLGWRVNEFPAEVNYAQRLELSPRQRMLKARMMLAHRSQWRDMAPFLLALAGRGHEAYAPVQADSDGREYQLPPASPTTYEQQGGVSFASLRHAAQILEIP